MFDLYIYGTRLLRTKRSERALKVFSISSAIPKRTFGLISA
jgi:hypothetical protein